VKVKTELSNAQITFIVNQFKKGKSRRTITRLFNRKFFTDVTEYSMRRKIERYTKDVKRDVPKVLYVDIETKPLKAWVWGTFDQNIPLEMLIEDWSVLSWSAKWANSGESEVIYMDNRNKKGDALVNDKALLKPLWKLMDEADIIIGQNSDRFDLPKLNARFIEHDMGCPSEFKSIDTYKMAKKFGFTSNKLAYMTAKLNKKYKKQDHSDFKGFKLWDECIKGNPKAWKSMETYNKYDVLSLEELFLKLSEFIKTENVTSALRAYSLVKE
jgi:DNA polymerase elongation subunit (family B)